MESGGLVDKNLVITCELSRVFRDDERKILYYRLCVLSRQRVERDVGRFQSYYCLSNGKTVTVLFPSGSIPRLIYGSRINDVTSINYIEMGTTNKSGEGEGKLNRITTSL